MFIPLHDANTLKHIKVQWVTLTLIAANVAIWLFTGFASPDIAKAATVGLGYIPAVAFDHAILPPELELIPEPLTYISYAFLHGSFWHLAGNMIFLWVFGDNVEDAMGHVRFLLFYLLCGIFAGLAHAFMRPDSDVPMIGASGAVAGVIAAYLMLHPNVRVWILALFRIPLRVSAGFALAVWIGLQIISVIYDQGGGTAWWAHIGGLIAGAVLILFMRKPGIPLFDRSTGITT